MPYSTTKAPELPVMVELSTISTPRKDAVSVRVGKIDRAVLDAAAEARLRALPLIDANDDCQGTITLQKLSQLAAQGTELTTDHATSPCETFPHMVPVTTLIEALVQHGIVLHSADPSDDLGEHWFGIITTADVNRPIFRANIYRMLVILESWFGQLIMDEFGDDWGAIRLLSDSTQRRIQEFYEEEKAEGVDLSPVTNATLSDLFHIASESNRVWNLIGFESPEHLRPVGRVINDLRNHIMHPVRPLVVNDAELEQLLEGTQAVDDMINRLAKQIGFGGS